MHDYILHTSHNQKIKFLAKDNAACSQTITNFVDILQVKLWISKYSKLQETKSENIKELNVITLDWYRVNHINPSH